MKPIQSILVATDLSEESTENLRVAAGLAEFAGADLHVLHSFDFQVLPYTAEQHRPATFASRIEDARRALSEHVRRSIGPTAAVASQEVVIYLAHKAILERAEQVDADLIVLGPHRKRAGVDAILGHTADRVVRTASVPCLVVRAPIALPLVGILVAVDLDETSRPALDVALAWSTAFGSPRVSPQPGSGVTVLHAVPREFASDEFAFDREVIAPALHQEVLSARERTGTATGLEVREDVVWNDSPAEAILEAVRTAEVDLVVVATRGAGAVKRALIGSVASAVARRATRSVLLVPPSWREAEPT